MQWPGAWVGAVNVTPLNAGVVNEDDIHALLCFGFDPLLLISMEEDMRKRRCDEDGFLASLPVPAGMGGLDELWAFLTTAVWEDGQTRAPGSVTLFRDGDRLKAAFNDRDSDEVGFFCLDEGQPILAQLDQALRSDRIDWRPSARTRRNGRG